MMGDQNGATMWCGPGDNNSFPIFCHNTNKLGILVDKQEKWERERKRERKTLGAHTRLTVCTVRFAQIAEYVVFLCVSVVVGWQRHSTVAWRACRRFINITVSARSIDFGSVSEEKMPIWSQACGVPSCVFAKQRAREWVSGWVWRRTKKESFRNVFFSYFIFFLSSKVNMYCISRSNQRTSSRICGLLSCYIIGLQYHHRRVTVYVYCVWTVYLRSVRSEWCVYDILLSGLPR